ncbi:ExeM/NucH family extracellular endonuclease [Microbacterium sp. DT81.1]|uniref:ExeM/NucH family extracellular endonuclease n=1 Tax=Microbacterium sp. DT81.1 TaxID=3393413 RepID=UPI003CF4CAD5
MHEIKTPVSAPRRTRLVGGVAAAAVLAVVTGGVLMPSAASADVSPAAPVVISEVYGGGGNSGAVFNQDFIELYNRSAGPVDVTGWAVQYGSASSTTWSAATTLTGTLEPGEHLLVGEGFGANLALPPIDSDVDGTIAISGTAGKVALTSTAQALTCSSSAACAVTPQIVDLVGWGASTTIFAGTGPAPGTANSTSVARPDPAVHTANNAVDFTTGTPTPAGQPEPPDLGDISIAAIQGTGASSPDANARATTRGVVTAAYPTGGFNGFVIQEPGTGGDADPATRTSSDALYVFSPAETAEVAIGDYVEVSGIIEEFNGLTELNTTSIPDAVALLPDTVTAPVPVVLSTWPTSESVRESLESMLILPAGDYTVTNTFSTNGFGEVGLAAGTTPLRQPTDVAEPGSAEAAAVAADNIARRVSVDDGASLNFTSGPNQALSPTFVSLEEPVRVGAAVTFANPMVLDWRNNTWKFQPTSPLVGASSAADTVSFENTRTAGPEPVGGDISMASFNVLNYFTTLGASTPGCTSFKDRANDPVTVDGGCDARGAWDPDDLQRQQDKIVAAINTLDADIVGLMEIENSLVVDGVADEATATLVSALNAAAGEERWAYVPSSTELPDPAEMDVITNAIIYQPSAAARVGESRALGSQSADLQAFGNAREPLAQVFEPVGGGEDLLFVVNHFKSKGSAGPFPGDADAGDGQGASNESRVKQATALRDWVASIQGATASVALVGDFNAYGQEDPLQVLYDAGYVDVEQKFELGESSYSFSGLSGSLDHVLLSGAAADRATGADIWTINSPESIAFEYSRYNYHGTLYYAPDPFRSSDHDPVKVGLEKGLEASVATLQIARTEFVYGAKGTVAATAAVASDVAATGVVEFLVDGAVVATAPLTAGVATANLTLPGALTAGAHEVVARYTGSADVAPSASAPVAITVRAATSDTDLIAVLPVHVNRALPSTLVAWVALETWRAPAGVVEFREGTVVVATVPVVRGSASYTLPNNLARGAHGYTATFVPSDPANVVGSTSSEVAVRVVR